MELQDQVAVVTGGAKGIGRAICRALAQAGAVVAVNYAKSRTEAHEVVRQIETDGGRAIAIQADVSRDDQSRALMDAVVEKLGRLDILVNNAGWTRRTSHGKLELLSDEIIERTLATNTKGPLYCTRAAVPHMQKMGGGLIVNITSVAGLSGSGSSIIYCGSKAALSVMTKSLARALAPQIRVNAVAPGFVDTGFVDWGPDAAERAKKQNHLGRLIEPEDIAAAVLYFATAGSALTGQEIVVDGGIIALGTRA